MEPEVKIAVAVIGIMFAGLFGGSALVVIGEDGVDVLTIASLVIAVMILIGVISALRAPPG